jgi:hypothetical protein
MIVSRAGLAVAAMVVVAQTAVAQNDGARWSMTSSSTVRRGIAATPVHPRVTQRSYYPGYYGGPAYYGSPYYYGGGYYYHEPYYVSGGEYTVTYNSTVRYIDESRNQQQVFLFPSPQYRNFVPQPVAYSLIPAYALPDGTVLADFGLGLEPVRRFCGDQFVLDGGAPPAPAARVNTQPAPSQPTQSAQNANAQRYPVLTTAAQGACYTQDRYGRFFAVR